MYKTRADVTVAATLVKSSQQVDNWTGFTSSLNMVYK